MFEMDIIIDKREQVQIEALQALKKSIGNCTLDITMRVGKTKIALDYIHWFIANFPNKKVLWIADNTNERDKDLPEEAAKWDISLNKVDIVHWRSIHTINPAQYVLVIFNECQNITANLCGYLHGFKKAKIIGLTGTYPAYEKAKLLKELGLNNIAYKYNMDEASEDNVISDYTINVVKIPMDNGKNIEVKYDGGTFMTSEYSSYQSLTRKIDEAKSGVQEKFMRLNRMRSVSKFQSKINYTKKIILENSKKNLKTLVFAIDNEHAKKIGKYIYSSHTDDKNLNLFNSGEISYLILINKGGTGFTYKVPIDCIIMLAPNSSNTVLQKIGRGTINNKTNDLKVIIPISDDTVQIDWVNKAFRDVDPNKIIVTKYNI